MRRIAGPATTESLPLMTRAEIIARWPSVNATVEERKRQIDEIGVEDFADSIQDFSRKYIDGDERQRRELAYDQHTYEDQERVNRDLGLDQEEGRDPARPS